MKTQASKRFEFTIEAARRLAESKGMLTVCVALCTLGLGLCANAQDINRTPRIIAFDAPGAGTGAFQGTYPLAINASGEIAGGYYQADGYSRGFLRAPDGTLTQFNAPGARGGSAVSVNPEGAATGPYRELGTLVWHGYLRALDGTFTEFEVPEAGTGSSQGTWAYNINPEGMIAGIYLDASNVYHGYLRAPDGAITTFDAPGAGTGAFQGTYTADSDGLSPQGAIVGNYTDASNVSHGYVRAPEGEITTFDAPDAGTGSGQGTYPNGINSAGTITGDYVDANNVAHGFVRASDGTVATFDAPGAGTGSGEGTVGNCINPEGAIVGWYADSSGVNHGFTRAPNGALSTFDVPGAGTGSGQGTVPSCNNPANEITGYYIDQNNVLHGFLRIP